MPRVSIKTYLVSFEIMRDICAYHPKLTPYCPFPSLLRVGHKQSDKMFGLFNGECLNMVSLLIFLYKCWIQLDTELSQVRPASIVTSQVSAIGKMFICHFCMNPHLSCISISIVNQAWDTSSLEDMQWMFYEATGFTGDIRYEELIISVCILTDF